MPPVGAHLLAPPAELGAAAQAHSSAARYSVGVDEHGMRAIWASFGILRLSEYTRGWQLVSQVDRLHHLNAI